MRTSEAGIVLAMVTIFQFTEGLSDEQAIDMLRTRSDWKYALHLPTDFPGFQAAELREFRRQLQASPARQRVFIELLARLQASRLGLYWPRRPARSSVDRIVQRVVSLNRLHRALSAMDEALQALAATVPAWLLAISPVHWYSRYPYRQAASDPSTLQQAELDALANAIVADIGYLLEASEHIDAPDLGAFPEVRALEQVWRQESTPGGSGPGLG
ncbi:MAG: transposase [Anaerolineae bacterium]|nr:transposase [Anaerolineae bacterium]